MPGCLHYDPAADNELDALYETDEDAAALIDQLLEEIANSPRLLASLCRPGNYFKRTPAFEVKRFQHLWEGGYTIYILKIRDLEGSQVEYRVLYAHHPQDDEYFVLAIMPRDLDYDADKDLIARIRQSYEDYGIPRYR